MEGERKWGVETCSCCETGWSNGGFVLDCSSSERVVLLMTAEGLWGRHFQPKRSVQGEETETTCRLLCHKSECSGEIERPWGPRSPWLFLYGLPCLGRQPRQLVADVKHDYSAEPGSCLIGQANVFRFPPLDVFALGLLYGEWWRPAVFLFCPWELCGTQSYGALDCFTPFGI